MNGQNEKVEGYLNMNGQEDQIAAMSPDEAKKILMEMVKRNPYFLKLITQIKIDFKEDFTIKDVHTEHCCKIHGCKYGDEDCPVVNGQKRQSFKCGGDNCLY